MVNSYSSPAPKFYIWDNSCDSSDQNWDNAVLLGMEFLYNFDCISDTRKNELLCGKIEKTLQRSPSQQSNKNLFLIAADDYDLPRRCEGFIKCKFVEEGICRWMETEIMIEPLNISLNLKFFLNFFQEKKTVSIRLNDCWVGMSKSS